MKELFKELANIIEAEIAVQEKTLDSLEDQRRIFVDCTLNMLEGNLKELDVQRVEAQALDKARESLKERIATKLGIEEDKTTLTSLSRVADTESGKDLLVLKERLLETAKRLRRQSRKNMMLIKQSIDLNCDLMSEVQGKKSDRRSLDTTPTYGKKGELVSNSCAGIVDTKL